METGFDTPEQAALSGYTAGADARVLSVEMIDDWHAIVVVDTTPSHPVNCNVYRLRDGRWTE